MSYKNLDSYVDIIPKHIQINVIGICLDIDKILDF